MADFSERTRRHLTSAAVPTVVSLLLKLGYRNTMLFGPRPAGPQTRFAGPAFTVRTLPAREDLVRAQQEGRSANLQARSVADIPPGAVLVVEMAGETRTAFMGDIMATHLHARGIAGVVLDGAVSDAAAIAGIGLPLFCMGTAGTPFTLLRMVCALQVPIACAGVTVLPGDIVMGDANGLCCIPAHEAEQVAQDAAERELLEEYIVARVRDGAPLEGTYPPSAAVMAEFEAWRAGRPVP